MSMMIHRAVLRMREAEQKAIRTQTVEQPIKEQVVIEEGQDITKPFTATLSCSLLILGF